MLGRVLGFWGFVFEEVGDLAIEGGAEGGEGGEADGGDVVVFDFGEVDVGDADLVGEIAEGDVAVGHDAGEVEDDFAGGVR